MRGPFNSLALLIAEKRIEHKFGIKTLTFKKSGSAEYFHYQGASYLVLSRIFKELSVYTKSHQFVDIGCGKGRVVIVAEHMGFNKLVGIELDQDLLECARSNLKAYPHKRVSSSISWIHANAIDVNYNSSASVYFLFNPFSENVLRQVLNKIESAKPQEAIFVYMNPLYTTPFRELQMESIKTIKTGWYTEAIFFKKANEN